MKPEMRESASMAIIKDKIYVFAGIGLTTFSSIWVMDIGNSIINYKAPIIGSRIKHKIILI